MLLALLWSCMVSDVGETPIIDGAPHVETVRSGIVDGLTSTGASVLLAEEKAWVWVAPDGSVATYASEGQLPRGAAEVAGERIALSDRVRVLRNGEAVDAGLGDALPARGDRLCADQDRVWIGTAGGLFLWRAGVLSEVRLADDAVTGPMACGGQLFGERVAWLARGNSAHALAGDARSWAVFDSQQFDGPVEALAVDGRGGAWAVVGGELHHGGFDGWAEVPLAGDVIDVLGGPGSGGVWVVTDAGPLWADGDSVTRPRSGPTVDSATLGRLQADGLGRLLVRDDTGVHRISMDRPLWVEGVTASMVVVEPVEIRVVATAQEELVSLSVALVEGGLQVELVDGVGVLDPADVEPGPATLRATADYGAGNATVVEIPLDIRAVGSVTWDEQVRDIHEGSCAVCHTGSTETLLDGRDAWQGRIDDILTNVSSGAMPLGGPPLPESDVGLIRAWRDGGFP